MNQCIRETEECFFLSCTSFPSLIRTHSLNQAWIPNTITCKVLCLGVIGLARTVFLKRLASLAPSLSQTAARSAVQEMQLARGGGWRGETGERRGDRDKGGNDWKVQDRKAVYKLLAFPWVWFRIWSVYKSSEAVFFFLKFCACLASVSMDMTPILVCVCKRGRESIKTMCSHPKLLSVTITHVPHYCDKLADILFPYTHSSHTLMERHGKRWITHECRNMPPHL